MKFIIRGLLYASLLTAAGTAIAQGYFTYSDRLGSGDSFIRPQQDCQTSSGQTVGYDLLGFQVDTTATYSVTSNQIDFDGFLLVYQGLFDPNNPLQGCLAANDDAPNDRRSEIASVSLQSGVIYTIVTTSFAPGETGEYRNAIEGPGVIISPTAVGSGGAGITTAGQRQFNRPDSNCSSLSSGATNTRYRAQVFSVNVNGNYTVESDQAGYDGYIHVYDEQFNAFDPLRGCLAGNDDGPGGLGTSRIDSIRLAAGRTYYLVNSAFSDGEEGPYTFGIGGPGLIALTEGNYTPSAFTGLWYDPALDGSGFNVVSSNVGIIITFYGYINGQQRWLISELVSSEIQIGQTVTVRMLIGDGGQINSPVPGSSLPDFGTLSFSLTGCTSAIAQLIGTGSFSAINQFYDLSRLLQGSGRDCPQ